MKHLYCLHDDPLPVWHVLQPGANDPRHPYRGVFEKSQVPGRSYLADMREALSPNVV